MTGPHAVLVLGGHGFMGSHVVRILAIAGWQVRILDIRERSLLGRFPGVETLVGDLGDEETLDLALEGIDAVVHAAGVALPSAGIRDPVRDVQGELSRSVRLAAHCAERKVRLLVFASSGGTIYGNTRVESITEEQLPAPATSYAVTKLATEQYLGVFRELHGLDTVVLRIANAYGPGQSPDGKQGFIAVFLGCLLADEEILLWGDGSVVRDFVYVEDVARAFAAALSIPASAPRLYNVATGRGYSLIDVMEVAQRVTGVAPRIAYSRNRKIDVQRNVLDTSRVARYLGWSASTSLEEGLKKTWAWMTAAFEDRLASHVCAIPDE